jgi:LPXTG-motif cell wall-anchored protein
MVLAPVGLVAADDDDPPKEAYPPQSTAPAVTPTTRPIPKTGNEGTDTWVKLGAGAVLVGGVMVAAASRRRREVVAS